jgi:hypothetical protein
VNGCVGFDVAFVHNHHFDILYVGFGVAVVTTKSFDTLYYETIMNSVVRGVSVP